MRLVDDTGPTPYNLYITMRAENLHIGMKVRHPAYGAGVVKGVTEHTADILFEDGKRTVSPESSAIQPAEPRAAVAGLEMPLARFIQEVTGAVIDKLGLEISNDVVDGIGKRWEGGLLVMKPADASLQPKDLPIETFFHKIVMMRNQLRVLEQKINGNDALSDADKVELQQYVTRCYGSMTTFNVLFKHKEDQF